MRKTVGAILAALLVGLAASAPAALAQAPQGGLSGEITVGAILPLTGNLASHGEENWAATVLAVDDFNAYLAEKGAEWQLGVVVEDSQTSPAAALDGLRTHFSNGIDIVLGPETSASLQGVKGYADSNGILLFSCCSTSPLFAEGDDLVFRMSPDDTNMGVAMAKLFEDAGIEAVVPVWRQDAWGEGLRDSVRESFTARGGIVDAGLGYGTDDADFSSEAAVLADAVGGYADEYGAGRVAVMYIGFEEGLQFTQSAALHDVLGEVRWFGSYGHISDPEFAENAAARNFAADTRYTTAAMASGKNEISERIDATLAEELGRVPSVYAGSAYDAVWVVGLAMEAAQSADPSAVAEAIPDAAAGHVGAVGSTRLNGNGDLAQTNYDVLRVSGDGALELAGTYFSADDRFEREPAPDGEREAAGASGGCLIASAAYGSEIASQVQMLREIRDGALLRTESGKSFVDGFNLVYYSFSPGVADLEREIPAFRDAVRAAITPGVHALGIMALADGDSEYSVLLFGALSLAALFAVYAAGPLAAAETVRRATRRAGTLPPGRASGRGRAG